MLHFTALGTKKENDPDRKVQGKSHPVQNRRQDPADGRRRRHHSCMFVLLFLFTSLDPPTFCFKPQPVKSEVNFCCRSPGLSGANTLGGISI